MNPNLSFHFIRIASQSIKFAGFLDLALYTYKKGDPLFLLCALALSSLYSTLDPTSVSQHFAFYELYPNTEEGKKALKVAWGLLSQGKGLQDPEMILPTIDPKPIIDFVNRHSEETFRILGEDELLVIEKLSSHLQNRELKGYHIWEEQDLLELPSEEIDLARGLLIAELKDDPNLKEKVRSYEALLDLMALQILARLKEEASAEEKIRAISDYVFMEMRFRFPPHSLHAKDIDVYTFLPSVLDSRRGVCLGVSILYFSLAQRLGLVLEAITPPGHIYVRHAKKNGEVINIETTARGIDIPSERYLGIETKELQKRTTKELIGLAFMNRAACHWQRKEYQKSVSLYEKAHPFLRDDPLLKMFLGFQYLFTGREKKAKALLKKVAQYPSQTLRKDYVLEDFFAGKADARCIEAIYQEVDETKSSIEKKQANLFEITKNYPRFRQGFFHLAITYLQLGKEKKALPLLEKYLSMAPDDPSALYYISALHFQRCNYPEAWKYLHKLEKIFSAHQYFPKAYKELRFALFTSCPEAGFSL